jgi:hypothetical protein
MDPSCGPETVNVQKSMVSLQENISIGKIPAIFYVKNADDANGRHVHACVRGTRPTNEHYAVPRNRDYPKHAPVWIQ